MLSFHSILFKLIGGTIALITLGCSTLTPATPAANPNVTMIAVESEALIKQIVENDFKRIQPASSLTLKLYDVTIADNYAIVDGGVGDSVWQFLLRQQQGQWQVVSQSLGEPFREQEGLLNQKVPVATVRKLINIQAMREFAAIVKREKTCITVIDDPKPPTNVRSRPTVQSDVVVKIDRMEMIDVLESRDGWLKTSFTIPAGWVSINLTRVYCGSEFKQYTSYLNQLKQRGMQDDRAAIDLLLRYVYRGADGAPGELANGLLAELLAQRLTAIAVMDTQSETVRRQVLESISSLGFRPKDRKAFAAKLAQQPNSPTAKTWADLSRSPR
jgi:phage terminase small subunit